MLRACDNDADVINMSLGGYDDVQRHGLREGLRRGLLPLEGRRRLLPRQGAAIVASAGNEHVRNLRQTVTLTGLQRGRARSRRQASSPPRRPRASTRSPATRRSRSRQRLPRHARGARGRPRRDHGLGELERDPGTRRATSRRPTRRAPASWASQATSPTTRPLRRARRRRARPAAGATAGVPKFDTRPGTDVLYGGWGELVATIKNSDICRTIGEPRRLHCFQYDGATFGWTQDGSMLLSSPQVAGVAALVLAAQAGPAGAPRPARGPAEGDRSARASSTTRASPPRSTGAAWKAPPAPTGYCHVTFTHVRDGSERDPVHPRLRGGDGRRRGRGPR